jgi:polar amino acid transport system substrate-binding protein
MGSRARALVAVGATLTLALGVAGCGSDDDSGTTALAPTLVDAGTLTVCTNVPYEPFEFKQGGKLVGFDIDLATQLARKLGLRSNIVNTDFDDISSGEVLNEGKCDVAIAGMTITGERARGLDFSSPYFNAAQAMVVKRSSGATSLTDLDGGKVAVQEGTTGEIYVTDHAPRSTDIVVFKDASQVDSALLDGDVDAAVYDNTVVGDVVSRYPEVKVAGEFDTGEQYGMAVKKNSNIDLLRAIDDMLADLQSDGGYQKIYDKWFGRSPSA